MEKSSFIQLLSQNYERMELFFGTNETSNIRIPLANQFTFSRETFNGPKFDDSVKKIHKQKPKKKLIDILSPSNNISALTYRILVHLVLHPEPEQELKRLISNEQLLIKAGFKNSAYQNIAALFLTDEEHAFRAKKLHTEMKKHHYFLTGKDDIPYAVLLTNQSSNYGTLAETMRQYYDGLQKEGFKIGDSLQAMTQLLALYQEEFQPTLIEYTVAIKQSFTNIKVKVGKKFYPYLALLALVAATSEVVDEIIELSQELKSLSMFAREKEYALITATHYVLHSLIENNQLADFNDSLLFMQAVDMSNFINDMTFFLALDILDIFI